MGGETTDKITVVFSGFLRLYEGPVRKGEADAGGD